MDWKRYYAEERDALGDAGLDALLERAPELDPGAYVFPHTRLRQTGEMVAAVARAVAQAPSVIALGPLHGARARGVAPGLYQDPAEFALDGFAAPLARAGGPAPHCRAVVGDPDLSELQAMRDEGAALVATADPIHHGAGYSWPAAEWRARDAAGDWALQAIRDNLELLTREEYEALREDSRALRSDFGDAGVALARLARPRHCEVLSLELVDYAEPLGAAAPTWVAGALVRLW